MSDNTITHLCKKIQDSPTTFLVRWEYDYDTAMFDGGAYTSVREEWTIDRERGYLLGERFFDREQKFANEAVADAWEDEHPEYRVDLYEYSQQTEDREDNWRTLYVNDELTGEEVMLTYSGYEILATDLHRRDHPHEYRYFKPHVENYEGVLNDDLIKYCIQDYERAEALNRGEWGYTGCIVTMYVDGLEVAAASLWGIESDSGDDYIQVVEQDLIAECKSEAKTKAAALRDAANKLDEYLDKAVDNEH
jgi:hypothetical protein